MVGDAQRSYHSTTDNYLSASVEGLSFPGAVNSQRARDLYPCLRRAAFVRSLLPPATQSARPLRQATHFLPQYLCNASSRRTLSYACAQFEGLKLFLRNDRIPKKCRVLSARTVLPLHLCFALRRADDQKEPSGGSIACIRPDVPDHLFAIALHPDWIPFRTCGPFKCLTLHRITGFCCRRSTRGIDA